MNILLSFLIFLCAGIYIFIVESLPLSPLVLLRALVLPMIVLLLIIYRSSITSWRTFLAHHGKWFLLFWGTVFIQFLVLTTGGLQSQFLILVDLFMMVVSFIFSFSISLLFLLSSFIVLYGTIALHQDLLQFILTYPKINILQAASLIPIVAVAYIVSLQYRLKEQLSKMLGTQIKTDQAIFEQLNELIIVTDPRLTILSVNDAVEHTLQKSRSELLNMPLLNTLLIKDKKGKLITNEFFFPDKKTSKKLPMFTMECTLVNSSQNQKNLILQVQPVKDQDTEIKQIIFILSYKPQQISEENDIPTEKARMKYEAMVETIKERLSANNLDDYNYFILLENIETDIFSLQLREGQMGKTILSRIDVSQLCKQTVLREQAFANVFQVSTSFEVKNFGWKDIAPLTVKNYAVKPEQLTGPFFTAACDVKKLELLIKKLLNLLVLLSSTETNAHIQLSVELEKNNTIIVRIHGNCPPLTEKELESLFVPYYGDLAIKTNLQAGSGLEGYLVKIVSSTMGMPVNMEYSMTPSMLTFTLRITKNLSS